MPDFQNVIAIDLGNSSGRVVLGQWNGSTGALREIYRFPNEAKEEGGHVVWDIERIWQEVLKGLRIAAAATGGRVESVGLDCWGAECLLVDEAGNLIGPAYTLRDPRQVRAMEHSFAILPRKRIYEITGIQVMPINALYGLLAHLEESPEEWERTRFWLGTPEYFLFRMTGVAVAEYTNAPNSQLVDAASKSWSREICDAFGLSLERFPPIVPPGTILGSLRAAIASEVGLSNVKVIAPACHDTGSAVAAIPYPHDDLAFISSGTWSLVGTVLREPLISEAGYKFNLTNEGGVGNTIRFLRNVIGLWLLQEALREWKEQGRQVSPAELAAECMDTAMEGPWFDVSEDKTFLAPGNMVARINAQLRAQGFAEQSRPAALSGIIFRSLARRYAEVINAIRTCTGKHIHRLCIVGGGVRNEALNRLAGIATGLEIIKGPSEATLVGNVAVQISALEDSRSLEQIQAIASRLTFLERT
jgi:sugar (pentulose or hexulose) kinase